MFDITKDTDRISPEMQIQVEDAVVKEISELIEAVKIKGIWLW